jgi:hypothetical protein
MLRWLLMELLIDGVGGVTCGRVPRPQNPSSAAATSTTDSSAQAARFMRADF